MYLKSLTLENFGPFKNKQSLTLKTGVNLIVGKYLDNPRESNNAGKSTLLEAISFLLFGEVRDKAKEIQLIHKGAKQFEVSGVISIDGKDITITRGRDSGNKAWLEVTGFKGTPTSIQKDLNLLFGMTYEDFIQVYQFLQGNFYNFMQQGPSDRKAFLIKCLKLEIWKTYEDKAKALTTKLYKEVTDLEVVITYKTNELPELTTKMSEEIGILGALEANSQKISKSKDSQLLHEKELSNIPDYTKAVQQANEVNNSLKSVEGQLLKCSSGIEVAKTSALHAQSNQDKIAELKTLVVPEASTQVLKLKELALEAKGQQKEVSDSINSKTQLLTTLCKFSGVCPVDQKECDKGSRIPDQKEGIFGEIKELERILGTKQQVIQSIQESIASAERIYYNSQKIEADIKGLSQNAEPLVYMSVIPLYEETLKNLMKDKAEFTAKHLELMATIESSKASQGKALELQKSIQAEQLAQHSLQLTNNQLNSKLGVALDAKAKLAVTQKLIAEKQAELRVTKQRYYRMNYIREIFSKEGIPSILVENSLSYIEDFGNVVLDKISRGKMSFEIDTTKEISTKDSNCSICGAMFGTDKTCSNCKLGVKRNKVKDEINISVTNEGVEVPFSLVSDGAGKSFVSLSLRFAIAKLLNTGTQKVEFLLMDEVLAALDSVNREQAISIIFNEIMNIMNLKQIFIISHCEINESSYNKIIVTKSRDFSTISQ